MRKNKLITCDLLFRCTVRSNSAVTIKWRRAGSNPGPLPSRSSVLEAGRLLRFNFFTVSDAGTYECVAINFFGSNSDSAVLTVAAGKYERTVCLILNLLVH